MNAKRDQRMIGARSLSDIGQILQSSRGRQVYRTGTVVSGRISVGDSSFQNFDFETRPVVVQVRHR